MTPQLPPGAVLDEDQLPPGATLEPTYEHPAVVGIGPDPAAVQKLERDPGIPLYQFAPGAPQKDLPPMSAFEQLVTNPAKQMAAGAMGGVAGATGLTGNIAHLLDTATTKISDLTGIEKGGLFKHIEDWARAQQAGQEQQASELRGGRDDLASQLYRLGGSTATSLPTYAVAAEMGGPIAGMAGLGALETADQGPANMLKAAAQNALAGKALQVMGPASRPIRLFGTGAMTYAQLRLQGVDHETALANAMTMGGLSATHPGGATTREILRNLPVPETTVIPPLFRNPNAAQRAAMDWYKSQGVHVNAPAASGSRFLGGLQRAAEATPFGAMIGEGGRQETAEGVRALSGRLQTEATPETPPGEFYQQFYDAEEAPGSAEKVPSGETDKEGTPILKDMQMPVPVGLLKPALKPIFEQMQWMPMADRNTSAGYQAIKRILEGPEFIPASQAETGLGGIKKMIREGDGRNQGIARKIAPQLQGLIDRTVQRLGGDEPMEALQSGRKAAAKQAGADWLKEGFDKARAEGEFNRQDFLWNRWLNLNEEAKRTMFSPKQVSDLNHFFLGAKNLFKNVNPSGTAQVSAIAHLLTFPAHPIEVSSSLLGGASIAKLLNSERGVKLLTEGLKVGGGTLRGREIQRQLENITGPPEEPPEGQPPSGGGPPSTPPGGKGGTVPPESPGLGERIKGTVKKFWEDETGEQKIPLPYDWKADALKQTEARYADYKRRLSAADDAWDAAESKLSGERLGPVTFKGAVTGEGPSISSQARAVSAEDARAEAYANWKAEYLDPLEESKRAILDSAKTAKGRKFTSVEEAYRFLKDRYTPPGGGEGTAPAEGATGPEAGAVKGSLQERLQTIGDEAFDRVKNSGTFQGRTLPSLFPAEVTKDMATWGAARIANSGIDFAKWSKAMLADAADISPEAAARVKSMLPALYAQAKKEYEHHAQTIGAQNIADLPKIMEYYKAGKEGKNWYNFVKPALQPLFGENTDLFLKMFAATSPNTNVTQNVLNAVKAYRNFLMGEPFTGMPAHVDNLNRAVAGVKMSGPKVGAFGPNLLGNLTPVTVDLWMARAILGRDTVTPLQSKLVDYMTSQAAKKAGLEPAEMQAAVWTGIKKLWKSKDTSAPPEVIVREYLDKNPDIRKLFEDSLEMSKEHLQGLQSKQAPAKPPRN